MELDDLEVTAKLAPFAGGTISSANLKACLKLRDKLSSDDRVRCEKLIKLWRDALRRHNAQDRTFCDYDLKTGDPVKR